MFKETFTGLMSLLGQISITANERDMLTYAKTEYGSDWQYAFHHMKMHNGVAPKMGVHI